tara:strand:+ start:2220 stop:2423 length:204 start_codon:yes stop_codon:yes gene_type:complete
MSSSTNTETVIQLCKRNFVATRGDYTPKKRSAKRAHRRLNKIALHVEGEEFTLKTSHRARLTDRDIS